MQKKKKKNQLTAKSELQSRCRANFLVNVATVRKQSSFHRYFREYKYHRCSCTLHSNSAHRTKTCKHNCPCNALWIKWSSETGAEIVLIAVQSLRARQGTLQSPKSPQTGPGCPGRLLRPSPQRHRLCCVPNRPHQPLRARPEPALRVRRFSCKKKLSCRLIFWRVRDGN